MSEVPLYSGQRVGSGLILDSVLISLFSQTVEELLRILFPAKRGNFKEFKDFYQETKAIIWP